MSVLKQLDARNLLCPLPVIRTQNMVKSLHPGDTLEVVGTDPGILNDIPAWCRISGHEVLEQHSGDNEYVISLKVGDRLRGTS
ncbi:MAG TPA: sulfurtransferase TusA family protein [Crenotrichaceae bacterium]|nr:sulfurtransferase TusA family protein [Crenotrichaceae bacterium]